MPEVASEPPKLTVSGWLYQPFASAGLEGMPWAVGAVSSYLRRREASAPFPALSRQVPLTTAVPLAGAIDAAAYLLEGRAHGRTLVDVRG